MLQLSSWAFGGSLASCLSVEQCDASSWRGLETLCLYFSESAAEGRAWAYYIEGDMVWWGLITSNVNLDMWLQCCYRWVNTPQKYTDTYIPGTYENVHTSFKPTVCECGLIGIQDLRK